MRRVRVLTIVALIAGLALAGTPAVAADDDRVTVSGVIRLADGRTPAANEIRVAVIGDGTTSNPSAILGFAAEGGAFEFSLRRQSVKRYTLAFSNAATLGSYLREEVTVFETVSGTTPSIDVTLAVGGIVRGTVRQTDGTPPGGGRVRLDRFYKADFVAEWHRGESVAVADDGTYEFRDIPAGPARLEYQDNRIPPLPGSVNAGKYPLAGKYWTELPSSPLFDRFDVAATTHEAKDIVAYARNTVQVMYPCPECGEQLKSQFSQLEWLHPVTGQWHATDWYSFASGQTSTAGLQARGVPPGTYRLAAGGGYGVDQSRSQPLAVLESEDIDLRFDRPRAALHVRTAAGDLIRYENNGRGRLSAGVAVLTGLSTSTRVIDAGDLTSDGFRDLLALSSSGALSRIDGTASGSFAKPMRLRTDFTNYTHIIPFGDVNQDGNLDILAKGRTGTLYWFAGDGRGGIGARTQIGKSGAFAPYRAFAFIGELDRYQPEVMALSDTGNVYTFEWDWVSGALRPLASRTKVASGWTNVTQMVGVGPFNYDAYDDVVIRRSDGSITLLKLSGEGAILGPITLATKWSGRLLI